MVFINNKVIIGIIPRIKGNRVSCIGKAARSEIIIVITNSYGCNSPICLLPINLITSITKKYKKIVLIKTINILNHL